MGLITVYMVKPITVIDVSWFTRICFQLMGMNNDNVQVINIPIIDGIHQQTWWWNGMTSGLPIRILIIRIPFVDGFNQQTWWHNGT